MTVRFDRVIRLDLVDSTNRYVADAARGGEQEGLVVIASAQSAGRGRQGRSWISAPGSSFLCSLLFTPSFPIERSFLCSTVVGLAARDAISTFGAHADLKWPNDVLIDGKKVGGILGEYVVRTPAKSTGSGSHALVVGVGINCSWPDDLPPTDDAALRSELENSATTLERELSRTVTPQSLEQNFLAAVDRRYALLGHLEGQGAVMEEYRRVCATIGAFVRVQLASSTIVGRVLRIDDDGRLVVDSEETVHVIDAGDVVHLRNDGQATVELFSDSGTAESGDAQDARGSFDTLDGP